MWGLSPTAASTIDFLLLRLENIMEEGKKECKKQKNRNSTVRWHCLEKRLHLMKS